MFEDDFASEVVTVELDWGDLDVPYQRDITRRQLGQLLMQFDDMADTTADQ
ncbi:hypothetical protein [Streptomyces sp. NPDC101206]|uniref:hypothetical protein n=1 Tax=Streptomyces sp. NPDC101206 TaxID=3366128 RepID=UPI003801A8F6